MLRRLGSIALIALAVTSCFGGDDGASVATPPGGPTGAFEGVTFAVDETDDGARLRIRTGDEIIARLGISNRSAPPWRTTETPNPQILTKGDPLRITPSESDTGEPYDQVVFRAIAPGITSIGFEQAGTGRALTVTVIVVAG